MFLKTLTMKGFKSFADTTMLDLEPGVTVVVGPNGSGKSNVVDAIAWVLGAQAPSAVRSQKMDDVIFAGTANRAALGRAEVSLTIDNSAGLLPIDFTEVSVTRILFRSGESEYQINGTPCRLLDIQELLSDSGVGRTQHIIISQGQIDAVLNARPEDRRLIIEEAAGVLKYRKRKEKSERRLAATEQNLLRLQDLLREVRRGLRPLEKQAEAAMRHGAVVAELTTVRKVLSGRELTSLRAKLASIAEARVQLAAADRELKSALARLDTEIMATEAKLTAMGGADLGDDLVRFEALRERARGLRALLAERARGIEREQQAFVNEAVVANLEAEAARCRTDLDEVANEESVLGPEAESLAAAEEGLAADRRRFEEQWSAGVAAPSSEAAEVRGELAARRAAVTRDDAEAERFGGRITALADKAARLAAEAERLRVELDTAAAAELPLVAELDAAEQHRRVTEDEAEAAEAELAEAQSAAHAWRARSEALALALDEARARAGAAELAEVHGVLGTLLDLVEVDDGWQEAFEAAAGEAIGAVVVADNAAARAALESLAATDRAGAVLALGPGRAAIAPPSVGASVRTHVRARRPDLDPLLDRLLAAAVVVDGGWAQALDVAMAHPDLIVVTTRGDRFGPTSWRVGGTTAGATAAALDEARARADRATSDAERARHRLHTARTAVAAAVAAESEIGRRLDENDARLAAGGDALQRVENDRRDAEVEAETLRTHQDDLRLRLDRERGRVAELEATLPGLEADEAQRLAHGRAIADARAALDERAADVGGRRADLDVRRAGLSERRQFLERRIAELDDRLARTADERREAAARRVELDARATAVRRLSTVVVEHAEVIETEVAHLREERRKQSEAVREVTVVLDGLRRERSSAEQELMGLRERESRAEIDEAEARMRLEGLIESIRRDLDCEPDETLSAEMPDLPEGTTPAARVRELERELRIMGPINPLALEEFTALSERHDFLQNQLEDVKSTRRDLAKVIRQIDDEIMQVFAAAYADVAVNFEKLFGTLFPGGSGRLTLTQPDNLLATGIEVEAKPSGKNVKKLSLLSGGERSLTALAFLFAVFRSRPSPFYVMDEVEAALDDVNLHRFLGLVAEFRDEAQLLIVSHQRRTMEAADILYGVSMKPGGSSRVISEKVGVNS